MRTILQSLPIALIVFGLEASRAETEATPAQAPPDTGISCPVGFVRVMQLHVWALSPAAAHALFKDSTTRTLPSGWKAFRGTELRKHIAKLASVGAAEVKGGWASQAFFGEPRFRRSYVDSTGDGLAMHIWDTGAGLVGSACVIIDSAVALGAGPISVEEGRSMVIGATLTEMPYALALRLATVPAKNRHTQAQAFREGVMKTAVLPTHDLTATKVTASIDSCLSRPKSGAGSAEAP